MDNPKSIDTLIPDIHKVFDDRVVTEEQTEELGREIASILTDSIVREHKPRLRMSSIGQPCSRKLWYEINEPHMAEPLRGQEKFKFLIGHIMEAVVLFLAKAAGHRVEGEQDEMEIQGVKGHRDAVINGRLVDVKTASPYSFDKFKEGRLKDDDAFGYQTQIQSYLHASQNDPLVTDKDKASFLVVQKVTGEMTLDTHVKDGFDYDAVYDYKKRLVEQPEPPIRAFDPVKEGESGNMKLPLVCSYCAFKHHCHPGLRTFLYAKKGPVFLSKVEKEPRVPEVIEGKIYKRDGEGNLVCLDDDQVQDSP